jgi:hypothetical protein
MKSDWWSKQLLNDGFYFLSGCLYFGVIVIKLTLPTQPQ